MKTHPITSRAWTGVALAIAGGVLATGCGSSSGSDDDQSQASSSAPTPAARETEEKASKDSCDLLSDQVAADVLGVAIVRREPHGEPGAQSYSCIKGLKRSSDPKSFTYVNASVLTGAGGAADEAAGDEAEPVSGVGDRAVFLTNGGAMLVVDGADLVEVQVVKGGVPGTREQCVTVAKDVLSNRG